MDESNGFCRCFVPFIKENAEKENKTVVFIIDCPKIMIKKLIKSEGYYV